MPPMDAELMRLVWQRAIGWQHPNRPRHRRPSAHQLPESLERPILATVHSGRYASLDDAMAEAASLLVQRLKQEQIQAKQLSASKAEATPAHKPIWEEIEELTASIPDEEFLKLPVDGAQQLDHYIYGSPSGRLPNEANIR